MPKNHEITFRQEEIVETEIREKRKLFNYNTVSYPLEYLNKKIDKLEVESNLQWTQKQQSYFVESLLLGLPVLNIVIAKRKNDTNSSMKILDGRQRLYTAISFMNDNLILCSLHKLTSLNGFKFEDLLHSRQKEFVRQEVKAIEAQENQDECIPIMQ